MALLSAVKRVLWGPPSAERGILIKLDLTLLPYFALMWFLFGVNQASYGSAYISGMGKDMHFKGKDFNYLTTTYTVTYAVFQIPATSILTLLPPRWVFVGCNIVWSVLTLVTFRTSHVYQVFILFGFEGAFAAVCYVGAHFIYGSWYKRSELGTRAAIFCVFGHLGSMTGAWIQAGLLKSLDGRGSLPAWRWLFIIVSAMTLPVVIFGWVIIPNLPSHKSAWFLTETEKQLAIDRLGKIKKQQWDVSVFQRVLLSWQFYLLPFIFMLYSLSIQAVRNNVPQLWMKSRGYSVIQQNNYPTGIYACAIVGTIAYAVWSDRIQSRWQPSLVIGATFIVGCSVLVAGPDNDGAMFFAFFLLGTTYAPQALWYSWMADVTAHDVQLRAITTGWMNSFDFAFVTWWPLIFYPVTDAPNYRKGYIASLVTGTAVIPFILLIAYLERRDRAAGKIGREFDEEDCDAIRRSSSASGESAEAHIHAAPGKTGGT
ncbi:hypothetical protein NLG97_g3800 [Lecanicillium saksenae]|uniref:Uncharacterized protein n=1 Tax=Lecanicillium saksenae TaxID=468837 RepID=A0ACC1QYY9_9HYPO|nr:hypothetical protein NLG97_g3800 [Lecanicillium saksenae]